MWIINDWEKIYSSAATRKIKGVLPWVRIPNRHDGRGFRRLMRTLEGRLAYSAFMLMVQIASRAEHRGELRSADGPLLSHDLEDKTGMPAAEFEAAFKILSSREIGWISWGYNEPTYRGGGTEPTVVGCQPNAMGYEPAVVDCSNSIQLSTIPREERRGEERRREETATTETTTSAASDGWPKFAESLRERYPTCDDHLIRKIAEESIRVFSAVTDDNLVSALAAASTNSKQYSPALYVQTIPQVIRSWMA